MGGEPNFLIRKVQELLLGTSVFEESIRRYAIDRKGRGRKEVIYLRVADISCTRGVCKSTGLSYRGPCGGVP